MVTTLEKPPTTRRVKKVVKPEQVAHLWAHRAQDEARSKGRSNFYFTGDTIYSYGSHFPIARHVVLNEGRRNERRCILLTTRAYGITTAKHIRYTERAIPPGTMVFNVEHVCNTPRDEMVDTYAERFAGKLQEAAKSRKYTNRLLDSAHAIGDECEAFCKFFGLKFPRNKFTQPSNLTEHFAEQTRQQRQAAAAAKVKQDRLIAEHTAAVQAALPDWLKGNIIYRPSPAGPEFQRQEWRPDWSVLGRAYFRPNGEEVESTLGAHFPADHGKRAYRLLKRLRDAGQSYHANGTTIHVGHFQVDSYDRTTDILQAGCHTVEWSEVERLAGVMGWVKKTAGDECDRCGEGTILDDGRCSWKDCPTRDGD